jgi:hypothetical protein
MSSLSEIDSAFLRQWKYLLLYVRVQNSMTTRRQSFRGCIAATCLKIGNKCLKILQHIQGLFLLKKTLLSIRPQLSRVWNVVSANYL